jgi:HSP20 family protein
MDVMETAEGIEILMDVPGVAAATIRLLFSQGTLIIAGRKMPGICAHREAAFHLAERTFGRFARAVRLTGAFDAGRASATLIAGELRIVLPRIEERRGRDIPILITEL